MIFKPVMMSAHAYSKRGRLKMQFAEMFCISSLSTTGSSTDVHHEDGAEWELGFCDCVSLLSLEKER